MVVQGSHHRSSIADILTARSGNAPIVYLGLIIGFRIRIIIDYGDANTVMAHRMIKEVLIS